MDVSHRWRCTIIHVVALMIMMPLAGSASAVNWEGHEGFFHEAMPVPELTEGIDRPILKPLPSCQTIREQHAENPYEQVAIPGKNCIEIKPHINPQSE